MIGLLPFESTIEQTTDNAPIPNTISAATMIKQKQLWTAATLLQINLIYGCRQWLQLHSIAAN